MHLSTMKRVLVLTILIVLALYSIVLYFTSTSVIIEDVSSNEKVMISSINETLQLINKELFRMRGSMHLNSANQSFASLEYHADLIDTADSRITVRKSQKRAVLFTMDSIEAYEKNSRSGGAAGDFLFFELQVDLPERLLPGELIVRRSLERAFAQFGAGLRVLRSDAEFDSCDLGDFDIVILDAWTWAAKGWVPKRSILGHEHKVFVLDFFGARALRNDGLKIPPARILTAYGSQWNSFLGYFIEPQQAAVAVAGEGGAPPYGVIWGKDAKHFAGRERLLQAVADDTHLVATATAKAFSHRNIEWRGHQPAEDWQALLRGAKFLLGLGNPLLGPSAMDAVAAGCVFINPVYRTPAYDGTYTSQHPFAESHVGPPYVCSYREDSVAELRACVRRALSASLPPKIPLELTRDAYLARVRDIFDL